jgi:integrase
MACCSRPGTARRTHTTTLKNVLTERLKAMQLDEPGMGWHAFRRFRNTWLRGRCREDIKNFWMGHTPRTMSELYSHLFEELELRLAESAQVGVGFDIPAYGAPNCSKGSVLSDVQVNM